MGVRSSRCAGSRYIMFTSYVYVQVLALRRKQQEASAARAREREKGGGAVVRAAERGDVPPLLGDE